MDKIDYIRTSGGHYRLNEVQLSKLTGETPSNIEAVDKCVYGYCRVSTKKQEDDLERQIRYVKEYLIKQGSSFKIVKDIGSGINYNNRGLKELIKLVQEGKVSKVVVLYKDRLVRFGFELIEYFCKLNNVTLEVIDHEEKTEEQELVEDLVQIITVFSCKLQGKRSSKSKKFLKDLKEDNDNN